MKTWNKLKKSPLFLPILCLFLVLLINLFKDVSFFSVSIKNGVLYGRLIDVLNRGSEIAILAVGQTLVVAVSAGTDISVGSVMALAACGGCMVLTGYGNTSVTTVLYPIGIGILVGIIYLGNFLPGCPIPTPILVTVVVILIAELILKKSSLELYIQSVGINSRASRICGINSDMICFICYTICGLCAGIAGMIASSRIYSADSNNIGLNYELDAILSVALGGNSLAGGKFNMAGSIIGAYTIQAITTTLLAMGVSTDQAPVFKAVIVVVIVVVQSPVFKNWRARQEKKKAAGKEAVA